MYDALAFALYVTAVPAALLLTAHAAQRFVQTLVHFRSVRGMFK